MKRCTDIISAWILKGRYVSGADLYLKNTVHVNGEKGRQDSKNVRFLYLQWFIMAISNSRLFSNLKPWYFLNILKAILKLNFISGAELCNITYIDWYQKWWSIFTNFIIIIINYYVEDHVYGSALNELNVLSRVRNINLYYVRVTLVRYRPAAHCDATLYDRAAKR